MSFTIFWFRRDLRLHDNAGLYHALKSEYPVLPLFIFDRNILDELPEKDARVEFLHDTIQDIKDELEGMNSTMLVKYGKPETVWKELPGEYDIKAVFTNHAYEPYDKKRDERIEKLLSQKDIPFQTVKDQVIFEKNEVVKSDGDPYVVFTPYSKKWLAKLDEETVIIEEDGKEIEISKYFQAYPTEDHFDNFAEQKPLDMPDLSDMGFQPTHIDIPSKTVRQKLIKNYDKTRNYPAQEGTSRLGIHFRFGTISIRQKARKARKLNDTFLNELIWRDFYTMIMHHFPHVAEASFRRKYDYIEWRNDKEEFEKWCKGETGYPMVDAGMRQLNQTGYMHNRVRMITASFLTKHLLIDWRWGESYFAEKLLDYELASNNGGWQWAAGSGTDAAPYFRIFNPASQLKKYDKDEEYIKEWIPEYGTDDYPERMVDHKMARERCLDAYKAGLAKADEEMGD